MKVRVTLYWCPTGLQRCLQLDEFKRGFWFEKAVVLVELVPILHADEMVQKMIKNRWK